MDWFSSDLHFGHQAMMDKRGFDSLDAMDKTIVKNWNDRVGRKDNGYLIGDISFARPGYTLDMLNEMNGTLYLIRGNHDKRMKDFVRQRFVSTFDYFELKKKECGLVVMCHYPFFVWNRSHYGTIHLHGHSHGSLPQLGKKLDVGVDAQGMAPISFEEVLERLQNVPVFYGDYHGRGSKEG
jgi:calcineurin-like phosphoesterase family protein